ncbi:MAG: 50S ribosomal protein L35 [Proteobacteria bacterium]|jgi:large subunit ribosomal protein L35|nr:MAG: 50S ribosomal protein L35 [Pseudomonadota bacterium]
MPKMKTKSAAKKRFKLTGTGKIKFQHAGTRHNLGGKSKKGKRQARGMDVVHDTDHERIARGLPYGGGI